MKASGILLIIACAALVLYATHQHLTARGGERVLEAIHAIKHGMSKEEVRALMGRDAPVCPASSRPGWLNVLSDDNVAEDKVRGGEYWSFYMGYPPRVLVIFFGQDGKVVFSTWVPT